MPEPTVSVCRLTFAGISTEADLGHDGLMRNLGYISVTAASRDAQFQLNALLAAGVEERHVFTDLAPGSVAALRRPEMVKLLARTREGDTVVVWRIDRLGHSLTDALHTVTFLRDHGIHLRSLSEGIDPLTPSGRLGLELLTTLAEYEHEYAVERVSDGIAVARGAGTRFGRPPISRQVIAEKLAIVAEARTRGHSAAEAAALVGWSRATLYRHQSAQALDQEYPSSPVLNGGP